MRDLHEIFMADADDGGMMAVTVDAKPPLSSLNLRLADLLETQAVSFDRLARRARRKPEEAGVHDLRVLARRIRATLGVARGWIDLAPKSPLPKQLRKVGRRLGRLRMLDVAIRDAATYRLDAAPATAERQELRLEVSRHLHPERRGMIVVALRAVAKKLRRPSAGRLERILGRRVRRLERALERAPGGKERMHQLRIEVKKTRYLLESLGRESGYLRPLQAHLGRSHDLEALQDLLGAHPGAARDEEKERRSAQGIMAAAVRRAVEALS